RRDQDLDVFGGAELGQPFAKMSVRRDASAENEAAEPFAPERSANLLDEDVGHRSLEGCRHIGKLEILSRRPRATRVLAFDVIEDGGLDPREAEIEGVGFEERAGKAYRVAPPSHGRAGDRRPAGIAETEDRGGLVERFSDRIVERVSKELVRGEALAPIKRGVAARDHERDRWKHGAGVDSLGAALRLEEARVDMRVDVIHADERNAPGERER